jgi:hypothetical protein
MKKIFILFIILLSSCSSRKVVVNKIDNEVKIDSVSTVKVDGTYTKETNVFIKESISELEYKPLDSLKPMVIDGKEYINTVIKSKQSNKNTVDTTKTKVVVNTEKKVALKKEIKEEVLNKEVKKEVNYFSYLLFILFIIVVFALCKYLKRQFPFIL